ncbi:MAG: hypothetical protein KA184_14480 [Candidatus Hydrogenedentes bacterium]|nr:hypothetical protein [Candidatus Hydrogenedentota bacterium]
MKRDDDTQRSSRKTASSAVEGQICVCMQYADTLYAVALRMTGDKAEAEALVHEAYGLFLRANGPGQPAKKVKFDLLSRLRQCFIARSRARAVVDGLGA